LKDCIEKIKTDGYCKIPNLYPREKADQALELAKHWYERTREDLTKDLPALAKNDPFVWNPQNKDHFFLEMLFGRPIIQQILMHFLNDQWFKQIPQTEPNYILRSFLIRSSNQRLPMHIDSFIPYDGSHVFVMQVIFVLEDHNEENGCTVVVPGSHKYGRYVEQSAFDNAVPIESKAGDVIIWDSRLWHGAGENKSGGTRWAMIGTFSRWWVKQMFNMTKSLPQEIYQKLTDSQKAILGYCSIPYDNEFVGVDMKKGYDSLPKDVSAHDS